MNSFEISLKFYFVIIMKLIFSHSLAAIGTIIWESDFPKLAEKLSVIRTDRHENLVRPKNILPVRKKSLKKFTVTCIMFSLAILE